MRVCSVKLKACKASVMNESSKLGDGGGGWGDSYVACSNLMIHTENSIQKY